MLAINFALSYEKNNKQPNSIAQAYFLGCEIFLDEPGLIWLFHTKHALAQLQLRLQLDFKCCFMLRKSVLLLFHTLNLPKNLEIGKHMIVLF